MSIEDLKKYDFVDSFTKMPIKDEEGWFYYVYEKPNEMKKIKYLS